MELSSFSDEEIWEDELSGENLQFETNFDRTAVIMDQSSGARSIWILLQVLLVSSSSLTFSCHCSELVLSTLLVGTAA